MIRQSILAGLLAVFALPAAAEEFRVVDDRSAFVRLVEGRKLTRMGIKLDVRTSGEIEGQAFGKPVTGAWRWNGGYFCRDLYFGNKDLGPNCQLVKVSGDTLRFIADRGAGQYADLQLR